MKRDIDGVIYEQFHKKNLWIEKNNKRRKSRFLRVYSYDTLAGYIYSDSIYTEFITWLYGNRSASTSRQITDLCKEWGLDMVKVDGRDNALKLISKHIYYRNRKAK